MISEKESVLNLMENEFEQYTIFDQINDQYHFVKILVKILHSIYFFYLIYIY